MASKMVFRGYVDNDGVFKMPEVQKERMYKFAQSYKNGTNIDITVEKHKKKRSLRQNNYYFGVVCDIVGEHLGNLPNDQHKIFKQLHNSKLIEVNGQYIEVAQSTKDLSTEEFNKYVERCRLWASIDLNCPTPDPGEYDYE